MVSNAARAILSVLKQQDAADGADLEDSLGLSEGEIKGAAVELRAAGFVTTSGAPDSNSDDGMSIDRLRITARGRRV